MDDETLELLKFLSRGNKLKIYSGPMPEGTQYHVCTSHPVKLAGTQFESICSKCGRAIWFSDKQEHLPKICIPCFLNYAKTHPTESIGNVDAIARAVMIGKRN